MDGKKLKIFICITKSNWGGAQKYVFDIATGLPKDQFDVSVLLGGDGELKKRLEDAGIRVISLQNSQRDIHAKKEFGLFLELLKIFKSEKPDVIHLNSSKMGGMGALAGRLAHVKKIIFIGHGWAFNEDRPGWQKILARILHIFTILLAKKTIAVSQITKDQIGKPWNKNMVVIRNGLREINFLEKSEARKLLSEKIGHHDDAIWIGTISELHKTKGLKYAIEAIKNIQKKVIFVIIGDGGDKENTEKLIRNFKLEDTVYLTGRIEMASTYLKAFDIVTLTSITEALPYFLLESGAAGLPVVATNVGGIPEIIEDNVTGILVPSKNAEKIKDTLEDLMENPEKALQLGNNLKQKVETQFTMEKMIAETIRLYDM